jgi:hypothetical protein
MGGIAQALDLIGVALVILVALLILSFLVGRFFENKRTRKRIMLGAIALFLVGVLGYVGFVAFILSGNVN